MITELIEGVNIGCLPDPFPYLANNKVRKVKSTGDLNQEYRDMYLQIEKSLSNIKEVRENDVVNGVIKAINNKELLYRKNANKQNKRKQTGNHPVFRSSRNGANRVTITRSVTTLVSVLPFSPSSH